VASAAQGQAVTPRSVFEAFAADFERAVGDDEWSRLERYLAPRARYRNVGLAEHEPIGPRAILDCFRSDVARWDRQFDTRVLVGLDTPSVTGNRLTRRWRCTYTLDGTPDLVLEGEARYRFAGDRIEEIEEELTPASMQRLHAWMEAHGGRL